MNFKNLRGKQGDCKNTGITLIALIITIVILLILAGVTINMVVGDNGLINKAKISVGKYENAQENENSSLAEYEKQILSNYRVGEVTDELLDDIADKLIKKGLTNPTGTIIAFYGDTAPTGYLACDGSTKEVSKYEDLAKFLGVNTQTETSFTLPNLQGEFLRGAGTNGHENQGDGSSVGQHEDEGLPNITASFAELFSSGVSRIFYNYKKWHLGGSWWK